MSKELEEAKKYLEQEIKVYDKQHEINKILLNYIDNSIPKEAIEDAIAYEKEEIKYSTDEYRSKMHAYTLNVLQELLEGK